MTRPSLLRFKTALGLAVVSMFTLLAALAANDFRIVPSAFASERSSASATQRPASDSADVVAVVERFRKALAASDSAAVLALLAPDATILESGGIETREEYRAHHLPADIAFVSAVPSVPGTQRVTVRGDAAWVASTSTSRGEFRGRQINSAGAELIVLSRERDGWKIRAVHWSSRTVRPSP